MAIFIFLLILVSAVIVFGHKNIAKLILGLGVLAIPVFFLVAIVVEVVNRAS